jgi:hypothetical protein
MNRHNNSHRPSYVPGLCRFTSRSREFRTSQRVCQQMFGLAWLDSEKAAAKERQIRKPDSVPETLPEQNGDSRDKVAAKVGVSGKSVDKAGELTGLAYQTLRNAASVCSAYELSRRRDKLSFRHHADAAALEPDVRERLLDNKKTAGPNSRQDRRRSAAHSTQKLSRWPATWRRCDDRQAAGPASRRMTPQLSAPSGCRS